MAAYYGLGFLDSSSGPDLMYRPGCSVPLTTPAEFK